MGNSIKTTCGICQIGCGVLATVTDGRVTKVAGDPDHPLNKGVLCPKGLASLEYLYHPQRLRQPLKRLGKRGEGKWKTISWEEAIDFTGKNLLAVKDSLGPEAIAFMRGAAKGVQDEASCPFCQPCWIAKLSLNGIRLLHSPPPCINVNIRPFRHTGYRPSLQNHHRVGREHV